jgi:hypothetical protein
MRTPHEANQNAPANSPRREFVTRSAFWVVGAVAIATVGSTQLFAITPFLFASIPYFAIPVRPESSMRGFHESS